MVHGLEDFSLVQIELHFVKQGVRDSIHVSRIPFHANSEGAQQEFSRMLWQVAAGGKYSQI